MVNCPQIDSLTPTLYACHSGSMHILQYLQSHGGDLQARSKNGVTGLHLACAAGHLRVAQYLIEEQGFDVDI